MASHTTDDPGPKDAEPDVTEFWETLPPASWTPKGGATLPFPILTNKQTGGNRLVLRERPYRRGVKIDSTGAKEKTWALSAIFSNQLDQEGVDQNTALYPDAMNAIIDSFDTQETGDLVVPTRGKFRCRAGTYEITENFDQRGTALVTLNFVEDNEDSVDARAIMAPTVRGNGNRIVQQATFDAQQAGMWDGSITGILDAMNELQGVLNTPQTVVDDTLSTAAVVRRNVDRLLSTFSDASEPLRSSFTDPSSSRLERRLGRIVDIVCGAQYENANTSQPKITSRAFDVRRSLFDIAAELKQDPVALMDLNQYRIEDPLSIDAGTVILVFAA